MKYIGYVKYQGSHIKDGIFDAHDAAIALLGFDEVFRYFLIKEEPGLAKAKFNLPVKIEEGSWGIFTPDVIEHLITVTVREAATGGIVFFALKKYLESAMDVAGKDGLFQTGGAKDIRLIIQKTFQSIQWVIKLVSHVKCFKKKYEHVKITDSDTYVVITNEDGITLKVPVEVLSFVEKCPPALFSKLASIVSPSQELEFGVEIDGALETTKITEATRRIFYVEDDNVEDILPELLDGENVTLTGVITRANEKENSIGFAYEGHIITCKPENGKSLADFKDALISQNHKRLYVPQVIITGLVERTTAKGEHKNKPRIFFSELNPEDIPEDEIIQPDLFVDNEPEI